MKNKVREIELRANIDEMDDCVLRAADLVLEGYTIQTIKFNPSRISADQYLRQNIYITLVQKEVK